MDTLQIFGLQFAMSLVLWTALAKWILAPWLAQKPTNEALFWLTLPHAFRYIGLMFLVPGVVARPLPAAFAEPAAYGDLVAALLALVALFALRGGSGLAIPLVWIFNVVGTVDLLNALYQGLRLGAALDMGATLFIPSFIVPLLLVTHVMIFAMLTRRRQSAQV